MSNDSGVADEPETYLTQIEPGDRPSESVVTAIASLTDASPMELEPLYDAIEPDALDAMFDHAQETDTPGEQRLTFAYAGFEVSVTGDGSIELATLSSAVAE